MVNNERNNNNNRGMFYAIMGVATLVITLIGATFAYFVATTNSAANAIRTGSTNVTLLFDDNTITAPTGAHKVTNGTSSSELTTGIKGSLVPVDTQTTPAAFAIGQYTDTLATNYNYAGAGQYDCRDANGNNICSVYAFTVTNPANVSQTIYPTFTVKSNGFTNLKYAVFKGTPAQVAATANRTNKTGGWTVNSAAVTSNMSIFGDDVEANGGVSFTNTLSSTVARKKVIGNPGDVIISARTVGAANSIESWLVSKVSGKYGNTDWTSSDKTTIASNWNRLVQILDPNESMTYTMIFWIEETYTNQSTNDMSKTFEAGVSFTTEGDGTGVTGNLIFS